MGISQQIGASSLIKPGVIDNSAQRPASPYEGQVIFQKDTDQMLVWNGTAWVIPNQKTQNPEGLEFIANSSVTLQSQLLINNVFSATYDTYRIIISCISDTTQGTLRMRLINSAGTQSSTNYGCRFMGFDPTINGTTFTQSEQRTDSFMLGGAGGPERGMQTLELGFPFLADFSALTGQVTAVQKSIVNGSGIIGGIHQIQSSYTGFLIYPSSGNITATVSIYGYRNS